MSWRTFGLFLLACYVAGVLWTSCAKAAPAAKSYSLDLPPLVEVEHVDFRYQRFQDQRDPYAPDWDERWAYRTGLVWNLNVLKYGYVDNDIHGEALQTGVFKTVGWHWEVGVHIPPWHLDVFKEHHSRHVFDQAAVERDGDTLPGKGRNFPVEDSVGVRINLYDKPKERK